MNFLGKFSGRTRIITSSDRSFFDNILLLLVAYLSRGKYKLLTINRLSAILCAQNRNTNIKSK